MLWSTLLESFADQVLSIGIESRGVRLHNGYLLEQIVEREEQAHCDHIVHLVHPDHHVTIMLDCGQAHDAVVEKVVYMPLFR